MGTSTSQTIKTKTVTTTLVEVFTTIASTTTLTATITRTSTTQTFTTRMGSVTVTTETSTLTRIPTTFLAKSTTNTITTMTMTTTASMITTATQTVGTTVSGLGINITSAIRGTMIVTMSNLTQFAQNPNVTFSMQDTFAKLGQVPASYTSVTITVVAKSSALLDYVIAIPMDAPPNITSANISAAFEAVTPNQMMHLLSNAIGAALDNTTRVLNVTIGSVEILVADTTTIAMKTTTTEIITATTNSSTAIIPFVLIGIGFGFFIVFFSVAVYCGRKYKRVDTNHNNTSNNVDTNVNNNDIVNVNYEDDVSV